MHRGWRRRPVDAQNLLEKGLFFAEGRPPVQLRPSRIFLMILLLTAGCNGSEDNSNDDKEARAELSDTAPNISASALQAAVGQTQVRDFYTKNGWSAVWSPRAQQALTISIKSRARHGLDHVVFLPELSTPSAALIEVALTRAAFDYASALAHGVADPSKLHSIYTVPRPDVDIGSGLITALRKGGVESWLESLAPRTREYAVLAKAYLQQRKDLGREGSANIGSGDLIHLGEQDPRIPQISTALVENRYMARPVPTDTGSPQGQNDNTYSKNVETAVKAFQDDYGISDDGVIGPDTIALLNVSPRDRARSLAVALERLRWLTRNPPATRIDVNTAAAELRYFRDGKIVDERKVVVGKPGDETPQLYTSMFRLVANPTWTVPRSVQKSEMAGKNRAYFRRNNLRWHDGWIVQKSGPRNSLGLVKFDLQNDLAIYLHDTPAKASFDKNQRQLSHGCVRVSDALGFAQMLAEQEGIASQWSDARATSKEKFVKLPNSIPVRLLYRTVYVAPENQVIYRTDPYGWNDAVAEALGFPKDSRNLFRSRVSDIGP